MRACWLLRLALSQLLLECRSRRLSYRLWNGLIRQEVEVLDLLWGLNLLHLWVIFTSRPHHICRGICPDMRLELTFWRRCDWHRRLTNLLFSWYLLVTINTCGRYLWVMIYRCIICLCIIILVSKLFVLWLCCCVVSIGEFKAYFLRVVEIYLVALWLVRADAVH